METINPKYYERLGGYSDKVIRLCEACCRDHLENIFIEGLPLQWFNPTVLKYACECPCHDNKKARAQFITLGPQGYLWQLNAETARVYPHSSFGVGVKQTNLQS